MAGGMLIYLATKTSSLVVWIPFFLFGIVVLMGISSAIIAGIYRLGILLQTNNSSDSQNEKKDLLEKGLHSDYFDLRFFLLAWVIVVVLVAWLLIVISDLV